METLTQACQTNIYFVTRSIRGIGEKGEKARKSHIFSFILFMDEDHQ